MDLLDQHKVKNQELITQIGDPCYVRLNVGIKEGVPWTKGKVYKGVVIQVNPITIETPNDLNEKDTISISNDCFSSGMESYSLNVSAKEIMRRRDAYLEQEKEKLYNQYLQKVENLKDTF